MRFKLQLEFQGTPPFIMPVNNQYGLSLCIDKVIHFGSNKFTQWLDSNGYFDEQRRFGFFNFSNLRLSDNKQEEDRLITNNLRAEILVSILADDTIKPHFIELFKNKELRFGDKKNKVTLAVKEVTEQPAPVYANSMDFRAVSPVVISHDNGSGNNKKVKYLSPEDKNYEKLFFKDLLSKYAGYVKNRLASPLNSDFSKLKLICKSKPVSRIVAVKTDNPKHISAKGYLFDFNISAPEELIKLGYTAGFGENNSLGFGFCEDISNTGA